MKIVHGIEINKKNNPISSKQKKISYAVFAIYAMFKIHNY